GNRGALTYLLESCDGITCLSLVKRLSTKIWIVERSRNGPKRGRPHLYSDATAHRREDARGDHLNFHVMHHEGSTSVVSKISRLIPAMNPLASWPRGPKRAQPLDTKASSLHAG